MAVSGDQVVADAMGEDNACWKSEREPWGTADLLALTIWTLAIVAFFWDVVSLRKALFYFDITEINYPYREFFARELRAGRFSRWCPGLYCGLPLYSESQAGYLHPLKYILYPWLETWQAFGLDVVVSIWLTGLGTYGWLRRHVGAVGALTGASVFGLGGFVWAHFIHTSMINALASVPFVIWALEAAWERGRFRPVVLGAVALACQVFAGHLQDTILTSGVVGLYALYRVATERGGFRTRLKALGMAGVLVGLGGALSAVQWIPSKELLDRSPRAGGLPWDDLTYGSWSPELLPSLIVREAFGTRARDTDWMDGFYPYHEMDSYMGVIAIALALLGAAAHRDRWVAFWVLLAGIGGVLMLGRFTILFDYAHYIPIFGSSRIPVRYHLWVSLALAALSAVGVDRLARPGLVRLRWVVLTIGLMVLASVPILAFNYTPVWTEPSRWTLPYHLSRYRWLGQELVAASVRTSLLAFVAWRIMVRLARPTLPTGRKRLVWLLPVLVIADLMGAHFYDIPMVSPSYWTVPPQSALWLRNETDGRRVIGVAKHHAGEPGFASEPVDFLAVRDALDWSLPPVWGLASASGATPMIPRRLLAFTDNVQLGRGRLDIESVSHYLTDRPQQNDAPGSIHVGTTTIYRNQGCLPRARLVGRPYYAADLTGAVKGLENLRDSLRERVIVEDPTRPLALDTIVSGEAEIARDLPEYVEIATQSSSDSYLVLADTYDPGWSATLDGRATTIRPAYAAFRAVFVPRGRHTVVFRYQPAGFELGLKISCIGLAAAIVLFFWPSRVATFDGEHVENHWPRQWPAWCLLAVTVLLLASALRNAPSGHPRWIGAFHRFTWGSGIEAMHRK